MDISNVFFNPTVKAPKPRAFFKLSAFDVVSSNEFFKELFFIELKVESNVPLNSFKDEFIFSNELNAPSISISIVFSNVPTS